MFDILDASTTDVIGVRVHGTVTASDIAGLAKHFETAIAEADRPIRLLTDMTEFSGMEITAFWQDLLFGLRHRHDFARIAVIGDQVWLDWWVKGAAPLVSARTRVFHGDEADAAWAWLREDT